MAGKTTKDWEGEGQEGVRENEEKWINQRNKIAMIRQKQYQGPIKNGNKTENKEQSKNKNEYRLKECKKKRKRGIRKAIYFWFLFFQFLC